MSKRFCTIFITLAAFLAISTTASLADSGVKDAWIHGRLEATYLFNQHLSNFDINTSVENGVVKLEGMVQSDVQRELAEEIALGLDGVTDVRNELRVVGTKPATEPTMFDEFMTHVHDASLTAAVKFKLLESDGVKGMKIDVDTDDGVVTLSGRVSSESARELAERLAKNTDGVDKVENRLEIRS